MRLDRLFSSFSRPLPVAQDAAAPDPGELARRELFGGPTGQDRAAIRAAVGQTAPRLPAARAPVFEPLAELPKVPPGPVHPDRLPEAQGVLQGWWNQAMELFQGKSSTRELARARKVVEAVRVLEPRYAAMSDAELRAETAGFKAHVQGATRAEAEALAAARAALTAGASDDRASLRRAVHKAEAALYRAEHKVLDAILPEAFAVAREAARRATGMFPYEVQLLGGALLHRGIVAELYTGEGKTLAAVMPAYLGAIAGHGFHIATVNDYLAERDAAEMGEIFGFLGLSVGFAGSNGRQLVRAGERDAKLEPSTRREAYLADITYATASELGFDYLRDNGVREPAERVQRPLYGIIADEVDAVLIDEARVPLIMAQPGPPPNIEALTQARDLVADLSWKTEVEWDQEEHWVALTTSGAEKVAAKLGIDSLYDVENMSRLSAIHDALQAKFLLRRDQDYTVLGDRVVTVGKNGHAMEGRRFTQGLHQAIEAKENVPILADTMTRASITMREYLGLYARRSGMTGTALSASDVFGRVYGLDVVRVPPRKPLIRVDHPDQQFPTEAAKRAAFLDDVARGHATGRPILVGVEWTSTAESLVEDLRARGIDARALTAKNDAEEAEIIANAGRIGAVTVVTPRGGRGVDVKLGGSERSRAVALEATGMPRADAIAQARREVARERGQVLALGGLLVLGYEHLGSRRLDDQLRGRGARQGDPGATMFYSSLADRLFDGVKEVEPLKAGEQPFSPQVARTMTERALDRSEGRIKDELTTSVPYDEVVAEHRRKFYELREDVLTIPDCREVVRGSVEGAIDDALKTIEDVAVAGREDAPISEALARDLYNLLASILPLPEVGPPPEWTTKPPADIRADVANLTEALFARRDQAVGPEINRVLERAALLEALDQAWMQHLDTLTHLRQGIGLRSYAQKDPRQEFRAEAWGLYGRLIDDVARNLTQRLMKNMPYLAGA